MRFDLSKGFPLLTTKKLHLKSIIYELLWFLRGDTNVKYLQDNDIVADVERKGALYEELLRDHPAVREIRRSGLLLAVELGSSERLYRMMELFARAGIMSDWFLYCDTAFRISPPLVISDDEVRHSAALIRKCLDELA